MLSKGWFSRNWFSLSLVVLSVIILAEMVDIGAIELRGHDTADYVDYRVHMIEATFLDTQYSYIWNTETRKYETHAEGASEPLQELSPSAMLMFSGELKVTYETQEGVVVWRCPVDQVKVAVGDTKDWMKGMRVINRSPWIFYGIYRERRHQEIWVLGYRILAIDWYYAELHWLVFPASSG